MTIRELVMGSMMALALGGCSVTFMGTPTSSSPGYSYGYGSAGKPLASADFGEGKPMHRGPSADDDDAQPRVPKGDDSTKPAQRKKPEPTDDPPTRDPVNPPSTRKPKPEPVTPEFRKPTTRKPEPKPVTPEFRKPTTRKPEPRPVTPEFRKPTTRKPEPTTVTPEFRKPTTRKPEPTTPRFEPKPAAPTLRGVSTLERRR